jgi:hypothetical protein
MTFDTLASRKSNKKEAKIEKKKCFEILKRKLCVQTSDLQMD